MGREHNRLTFIVSFGAMIIALLVGYFTTCNSIHETQIQNTLILIIKAEGNNISMLPSNPMQKIESAQICIDNKIDKRIINLSSGYSESWEANNFEYYEFTNLCFRFMDSLKCKSTVMFFTVKSVFFINGRHEDRSLYKMALCENDGGIPDISISYIKQISNDINNKTKTDPEITCLN